MNNTELVKRSRWQHLYYSIVLYANVCALSIQSAQDVPVKAPGAAPTIEQSRRERQQKKKRIKRLNEELFQAVKDNNLTTIQQLLKKIRQPELRILTEALSGTILHKIDAHASNSIFRKFESHSYGPSLVYSTLIELFNEEVKEIRPDLEDKPIEWLLLHEKLVLAPLKAYASSSIKNAQNIIDLAIKNKHYYLLYPLLEIYKQFEQTEETIQWICEKIKSLKASPAPLPSFKYITPITGTVGYIDSAKLHHEEDAVLKHTSSTYGHIPIIWITSGKEGDLQQEQFLNCPERTFILSYPDTKDPIYKELFGAICFFDNLIIASRNITCKLLASAYNSLPAPLPQWQNLENRVKNDWLLYRVRNSQYCVWVPASYRTQYLDLLNLNNLILVKDIGSSKLNQSNLSCPTLISEQNSFDNEHPYTKSDPEKIFKPKDAYQSSKNKATLLDFYITGHGGAGTFAACIPIEKDKPEQERLTSLLTYLNDNLSVGTVTISTCAAGGLSRSLLTQTASGMPRRYSYNLIVQSSSDKPTISRGFLENLAMIRQYFKNAARLAVGEVTIDALCNDLTRFYPKKKDEHGSASIAQALLPGMQEFIGCDSKIVFQASQDTVRNNAPIEIKNKKAALWYVNDVPQTVTVYPNQPKPLPSSTTLPLIPSRQDTTQTAPLVYPEFIPMDRGTNTLRFNHIIIGSDDNSGGILHFIRDAFLDVGPGPSEFNIFIDQLDGLNDIITPIQAGISDATPRSAQEIIEHWRATLNTQISLHNILIYIRPQNVHTKSRFATIFFPFAKGTKKILLYRVELVYDDESTEKATPWSASVVPSETIVSPHDIPQVSLSETERIFRMLKQSGITQKQHEQAFDDFAEDAINTVLNQMKDIHGLNIILPDTIDPSEIRNDAPDKRGYAAFKKTVPPEKLDEVVNQFNYLFQKALAAASEKSRPATLKAIADKSQLNRELHKLQLQFKKLIQAIENDNKGMVNNLLAEGAIKLSLLSGNNREELYKRLQGKPDISYAVLVHAISEQDKKTIEDITTKDKISFRFSETHRPAPLFSKALQHSNRAYGQYVSRKIQDLIDMAEQD